MRRKLDTGLLYYRLQSIMREKKLYLDSRLTRNDLAREAMTNRTYVTAALREQHTSFHAFVGEFRMQHALMLLRDEANRDVPLDVIATRSGFANADTMNRQLKKGAGETARAMRQRLFGKA
ncbi:MAG: AraC family transcriptional regulator [Bacteroidales bacterium]|nr:AraC family transcriptional regulator [Bacteroidales bacterium]